MFNYHELEKEIFNFLYQKHLKDSNFTFSVRKKSNSSAKDNIFIGSEGSHYFGFTFWTIPFGYPGASMDLIDVIFKFNKDNLVSYYFVFNQTKRPHDEQNRAALEFIQQIKPKIKNIFGFKFESSPESSMENYKTKHKKEDYDNLEDLQNDFEKDLEKLLPIINRELENYQKSQKNFNAHRIDTIEFNLLLQGLQKRLEKNTEKYGFLEGTGIVEITNNPTNYWIFQGNPDIYDVKSALKNNHLSTWTVKAHKEEIKIGDKVILWLTGKAAGCYALCEVTSEIMVVPDSDIEFQYNINPQNNDPETRVSIKITHNLSENPILKSDLGNYDEFVNLKVGNQGTNFIATKEEYNKMKDLAEGTSNKQYWTYVPGLDAKYWDECFQKGIMLLGWSELGDLSKYKSREEITSKLQSIDGVDSKQTNNTLANWEFANEIKVGDVVFAKTGRNKLLGYGIVKSEYFFDENLPEFKSCRQVEWKKKGEWIVNDDFAIKTLTNITKYKSHVPEYNYWYEELLGIINSKTIITQLQFPLNSIFYGPPGTGKTYNTINKALEIIGENIEDKSRKEIKDLYDAKVKEGQIVFTTFHQSMSYEDFIEGIKPVEPEKDGDPLTYEIVSGIFKRLCSLTKFSEGNFDEKIEWLKNECSEIDNSNPIEIDTGKSKFKVSYRGGRTFRIKPELTSNPDGDYPASIENIRKVFEGGSRNEVYNPTYVIGILNFLYKKGLKKYTETVLGPSKPYVLIIDEINRGNIAAIFGELITLIEDDKRLGKDEALEVVLPYSKEKFGVPPNLYIIGTMNTADRSVEALDTALRRRFSFEEMQPKPEVIATEGKLKEKKGILEGINLVELLSKINLRIEKLLDKDHLIGHSYFMSVTTIKELQIAFHNKIIPLLQEYFFGDYGKIGLVLGKEFFDEIKATSNIFADFDDYDTSQYDDKIIFKLKNVSAMNEEAFKSALAELLKK